MNRLRGLTCYQVGPIDRVSDNGSVWRDEITPFLQERGVRVFNPLKKPVAVGLEDDDSRSTRKKLKEDGRFDEFRRIMKLVRIADLRMVDKSDFLIVNYDMDVHLCGTMEEIVIGNLQKKPIIICCPQGKAALADWIFAMIPHQMFFSSWDEVKEYLRSVDEDEHVSHLKRWLFFHADESRKETSKKVG